MPFEDFKKRGGRTKFGFPAVTLMRSGGIALNEDGYAEIGRPKRIVFAYEREERRIGIRAGEESEEYSYPVRNVSPDSWWIPARAFLRYYDIAPTATTKYRARMDGTYLTCGLKDTPVHRERRAKKKEIPSDEDRTE